MNFHKDILLIDLESTGLDVAKHEIIQIGAILLDKKTLKEKKVFYTFVKPTKWKQRDPEAMAVNNITAEQLKLAPSLKQVITEFGKLFDPKQVILAHYGGPLDMDMMRAAYKKLGKRWEFDHHFFNLWGLFFSFVALKGKIFDKKKFAGFSLDHFIKYFGMEVPPGRHDALTDCRVEADIFRLVMKELK
jgi:DNA polymerase III epsilon subunit-like protein